MMPEPTENRRLRTLLDAPKVPDGLRRQLLDDLEGQPASCYAKPWGRGIGITTAIAATLIVALAVWLAAPVAGPDSTLISAFQAHAAAERQLTGDRSGGIDEWLNTERIGQLPQGFSAQMAKNCEVGRLRLKHLRVAGPGAVITNLFIEQVGAGTSVALEDGVGEGWLVVHPRPDIAVLALFSPQDGPAGAGRLINAMFSVPDQV